MVFTPFKSTCLENFFSKINPIKSAPFSAAQIPSSELVIPHIFTRGLPVFFFLLSFPDISFQKLSFPDSWYNADPSKNEETNSAAFSGHFATASPIRIPSKPRVPVRRDASFVRTPLSLIILIFEGRSFSVSARNFSSIRHFILSGISISIVKVFRSLAFTPRTTLSSQSIFFASLRT